MFTEKMTVDSFDDIVAINAMNRPGPLEKYLNKYGYWKDIDKGVIEISESELKKVNKERYPFAFMEKSLKSTYGALLYQEQFMFLVSDMTGMSFGEADSFRRAIAWREDNPKYYTVKGYFDRLETSMLDKGYTKDDVINFVQYCRDFMGYSFNSAHATCLTKNNFLELENGSKTSIKDVLVGDKVLCYNEKEKINEFKKVNKFFNQGVKKVYKFKLKNGNILEATDDHKVLASDGKYYSLKFCFENKLKIKVQ